MRHFHQHFAVDGHELPDTIAAEMEERILDGRLVVALADRFEMALENADEFFAKRHLVAGDDAAVKQVDDAQ